MKYRSKTEFELDFENELIYQKYCSGENYRYEDFNTESRRCIIFFSANSLYSPNEADVFQKRIIEEDHYEGLNIAQNKLIRKYFGRCIWVRDIYKSWYVAGINNTYDSIDKVCELLESLGGGYEYYTVGGSSGGYMATICGIKLHAKAIYNLSGQYNLWTTEAGISRLLKKFTADENRNQYYDIGNMTLCDIPILYFYPSRVLQDEKQATYIHGINQKNIYYFPIISKVHGNPIKGRNLPYILTQDWRNLTHLSGYGRETGAIFLFYKTAGIGACIKGIIGERIQRLKEKLYPIWVKITNKRSKRLTDSL